MNATGVGFRALVLLAWMLLLVAAGTARGQDRWRIDTRDGKSYMGEVRVDDGLLEVKDGGGAINRVRADAVARMRPAPKEDPRTRVVATTQKASSRPGKTLGLRGQYFKGDNLAELAFERVDPTFEFEGKGRDPGQLEVEDLDNTFSVRWTGYVEAPVSGEYRLRIRSDDGMRLWIDNTPLVDKWGAMVLETEAKIMLEAGKRYPLVIEYMDIGGGQQLHIEWEAEGLPRQSIPVGALTVPDELEQAGSKKVVWPGQEKRGGWKVEYFAGLGLKESLGMRTEIPLRLDWSEKEKRPTVGTTQVPEQFSARVTGRLYPDATGEFEFASSADDRVRISFDDKKVLDTFEDRGFDKTFKATLTKGKAVKVVMEYENDIGPGYIKLSWKRPGTNDFRLINSGNVGLPEGEETGPLARLDPETFPRRVAGGTSGGSAGGKRVGPTATGRVWFPLGGAGSGGGKPKVEWVENETGKVLATGKPDSEGVVLLEVSKLPAGKHKVYLRATDGRGRVAESNTATTEVEGVGETGLEGPWQDVRVGGGEENKRMTLGRDGDTLLMSSEAGDFLGTEDRLRLLSQGVTGEAMVTARLVGVGCEPTRSYAAGGLMVRVGSDQSHQFVAVTLDAAGRSAVVYRRDHGGAVQSVPVEVKPGMWARIGVEQSSVRVLVSEDGRTYRGVWSMEMGFGNAPLLGAFVVTRGSMGTLRTEGLSVRQGAMAVSEGRGVMLISGSFLAGDVRIESDGRLVLRSRGKEMVIPRGAVAYIAFARMTSSQVELMNRRSPCALLRRDDIVEGDLVKLQDNGASIESVLFGEQRYDIYNGEIRAVSLRPIKDQERAVTVLVKGGTVLRGSGLRVTKEGMLVEGAGVTGEYPPVELGEVAEVVCK